jgi:hypothetical protein
MATPPTVSDFDQSTWTDFSTANEVAGSVTWAAGDLVVVLGVTGNNDQGLSTPTVSGLTFAALSGFPVSPGSGACNLYAWSATAGSGGSGAINSVHSGANTNHGGGIVVFVYASHAGVGAISKSSANESGIVRSLTRTGANSGVVFILGDFDANADVTVTNDPSSGATQRLASQNPSGSQTAFCVNWTDQGAAGTTNYGVAGFTDSNVNVMAAIEILGVSTGAAILPKSRYIRQAVNRAASF